MNFIKKIFNVFLSALTLFSLICMPISAETGEEIQADDFQPISTDSYDEYTETYYYDSETGKIDLLNTEGFAEEDDRTIFSEHTFKLENEEKSSIDTGSGLNFDIYLVRSGIKSVKNKKFTWFYNLDCPTSPFDKPNVTLKVQLRANFTDGRTMKNYGTLQKHEYKTHSDYSTDFTWETEAKTGYYSFKYTLIDHDKANDTATYTTEAQLCNRTHATLWEYNYSVGNKEMNEPRADWKKEELYKRKNLRDSYFKQFEKENNVTVILKETYDIHHIRPLSLGGDNSYANLIHLPDKFHTKVTSWFNGY